MIRSILGWPIGKLIQIAEIVWKESLSSDDVRSFLETSLKQHIAWQADSSSTDAVQAVLKAHELSTALGLPSPSLPTKLGEGQPQAVIPDAANFGKLLRHGKVIDGAAESLEVVVSNCELSCEFCGEMERIVRHIEIKRQSCLPLAAGGNDQQRDLIRARISVSLLIYGQRQNDIRFLNSAMKLNDWLLMRHRKSAPSPTTAKLLYALMLQEVTMSGLTTCA